MSSVRHQICGSLGGAELGDALFPRPKKDEMPLSPLEQVIVLYKLVNAVQTGVLQLKPRSHCDLKEHNAVGGNDNSIHGGEVRRYPDKEKI